MVATHHTSEPDRYHSLTMSNETQRKIRFGPKKTVTFYIDKTDNETDTDNTNPHQRRQGTEQDQRPMAGENRPVKNKPPHIAQDKKQTNTKHPTNQQDDTVTNQQNDQQQPNTNNGTQKRKTRKRKRIRKNKQVTIAVLNVRGLKGKTRSLETILEAGKIKIAAISETHLKNNETPNIKGYKWAERNRRNREGGGVGILIANDIAKATIQKENLEEDEKTEVTWIELKTRPKPIYIGAFYGPQENSPIEETNRIYDTLDTQTNTLKTEGEVILVGDFNAKLEIKNEIVRQEQ